MELPLFKRELIEASQRKRTYVLRVVCVFMFSLVFLTAYSSMMARSWNVMAMLGRGRDLTFTLFATMMATIFALAPAMACGAITSEKEKQTLGLLLISRLSPFGIVVEKLLSRLTPLLSLVLVSLPLFGVSYLFGGLEVQDTLWCIAILFLTLFQLVAVAVFYSALLETSIGAFWLTYLTMLVIYFTLPVLTLLEIIPDLDLFSSTFGREDSFLFCHIYQLACVMNGPMPFADAIGLTLPSFLLSLLFVFLAWLALVQFAYGSAFSIEHTVRGILLKPIRKLKQLTVSSGGTATAALQPGDGGAGVHSERAMKSTPTWWPVAWREQAGSLAYNPLIQFGVILCIVALEVVTILGTREKEVFAVLISIGGFIAMLLITVSLTCKLFTRERERETWDTLLSTPLTSNDIVLQKLRPVNWMISALLVMCFAHCLINLHGFNADRGSRIPPALIIWRLFSGMGAISVMFGGLYLVRWLSQQISATTESRIDGKLGDLATGTMSGMIVMVFALVAVAAGGFDDVRGQSPVVYVFGSLCLSFVYMKLVKWTGVFFGLYCRTQMKAMLATIVSILLLCFLPMLLLALMMLSVGADPDDFPLFFFSTPIIVYATNEVHELNSIHRRWAFDSDIFVLLVQLTVYGGLTLTLKTIIMAQLPTLLNRSGRDPSLLNELINTTAPSKVP